MALKYEAKELPLVPANAGAGDTSFDDDVIWLNPEGQEIVILAKGQTCSAAYAAALREHFAAPKKK